MLGEKLLALGVAGCAVAWIVKCTRRRLGIAEKPSKMEMRQSFIRTLQECDQIIIENIPGLKDKLCALLDTDYFVTALRHLPPGNPNEKRRLWEQLKNTTFSRLYASVFSSAYLALIARVHIGIVSGLILEASNRNQTPPHFPDTIVHFIHYGLPKMCADIHRVVSEEMKEVSLTQKIPRQEFKILLKKIELSLKSSIVLNLTEYVMPTSLSGYTEESMLAMHDVLDVQDAKEVLDNLVSVGVSYTSSILSGSITWVNEDSGMENVVNGGEAIAKIVPVISHSIHSSFVAGKDGIFYQIMTDKDLTKLTANVFECFAF